MNNTIKMLAKQTFPTRADFRRRFAKRLGGVAKLFDPISELLAEEAESFLMELWLKEDLKKEHRRVIITTQGQVTRDRHYCPHCRNRNIYAGYRYCPKCGADVIWQNPLKKVS